MTTKELPLVDSPIRGYMMYSYHLAVTFARVPAWPWFYGNHVQLQCDPAQLECADFLLDSTAPKGEVHFTEGTWKFNPWLRDSLQVDKASLASSVASVSQYVLDRLDEEFYVETFIDEYHIPVLFNGGVSHLRHRLLIFGCDEKTRRFKIIGFDKSRLYRKLECTFDEFERAFNAVEPLRHETTKLYRIPADSSIAVKFEPARCAHLLRDYLTSTNTLLDPDLHGKQIDGHGFWYGMNTYRFLEAYVATVMEVNRGGGSVGVDIRGFNILWEHKTCMSERMKWMRREGFEISNALIEKYDKVVSLCGLARNKIVMCGIGLLPRGKGHLIEVPAYLQEAREIETEVLEELLETAMIWDRCEAYMPNAS
jgi:hypothetical protein